MKYLHTMVRVKNIEDSLDFYCNKLGLKEVRRRESEKGKFMGINDLEKKYSLNEIVSGDSIFCATGITSGDLVKGIIVNGNTFTSETLVTHKKSNLKENISKTYDI